MTSSERLRRMVTVAIGRTRRLQLVPLRAVGLAAGRKRREGQLRLLAHLPSFLLENRAGSEVSIATTLEAFVDRGWSVTVVVDADGPSGTIGQLDVIRTPSARNRLRLYREADVVVTQLASRNRAMRWSTATRRPLVHVLRMGGIDPVTMLGTPALVVFNSEHLRNTSTWKGPSIVLHPPIRSADYRTTPGNAVTLVNLNVSKGARVFYELARRRPDLQFLGVRGGWGDQVIEDLPNLEIVGPVADMREVYRRTGVLLMPSDKESFGRVAVEAAASGIPVIASPLPGIREAMGDAARYAARDDADDWERLLVELGDPAVWQDWSRRSAERSEHWDASTELGAFVAELERLARTAR